MPSFRYYGDLNKCIFTDGEILDMAGFDSGIVDLVLWIDIDKSLFNLPNHLSGICSDIYRSHLPVNFDHRVHPNAERLVFCDSR